MKRIIYVCIVLVFLAASAWAQRQGQSPPYVMPPMFPQGQAPSPNQRQPQDFPPDTAAPERHPMSTTEIQRQIQDRLSNEPALANTNLTATADENSVVLTGTVNSTQQHDIAVHIARSYAGSRQIVDKIKIAG
jgi:osmotically-inducible protein OsmY